MSLKAEKREHFFWPVGRGLFDIFLVYLIRLEDLIEVGEHRQRNQRRWIGGKGNE